MFSPNKNHIISLRPRRPARPTRAGNVATTPAELKVPAGLEGQLSQLSLTYFFILFWFSLLLNNEDPKVAKSIGH